MVEVRTEQLHRAYSKLVDDGKDLHISGEPGIGKTEFLTNLKSRLSDAYTLQEKTVRIHHTREDLQRDLLHIARQAAATRDAKPNQLTSLSGGIGAVTGGGTIDDRVRDPHKLKDLTTNWSSTPLVLFVDDIHKLEDDEKVVREVINELSSVLGGNVHLVTAGQISGVTEVEQIHLNLYTHEETALFLKEEFGDLPEETVREVHTAVEGHPLYLSLLTESSEDEQDFHLPKDKVSETIEERYIENLPLETVSFLRQVAPLRELDEKTCSGIIDDLSPIEIDRILRELDRRVIVQKVNQTDEGDHIYKIHQNFREFLVCKHRNQEQVHRKAFRYHMGEIVGKLGEKSENPWVDSLPHSFYARYHLTSIEEDADAELFFEEFNKLDLTYPRRAIVILYAGLGIFPTEMFALWQHEHATFSQWVYNRVENEPQAELVVRIAEWGLSQFGEEPLELSDVQVEGSIDDLDADPQPSGEAEISEEHAKRLRVAWQHTLRFFFIEEPYRSKTHREHALKLLHLYGISVDVLSEFKTRIKAILRNSEFGDEFEELMAQYTATIGDELEHSLSSRVDFYKIRDEAMALGKETFENIHYSLFLQSGLLKEIALEGGEVLEDADNPAFAMIWYGLFTSYFRNTSPDSEAIVAVKTLYLKQVEERREYEQNLEYPVFKATDSAEKLVLDEAADN